MFRGPPGETTTMRFKNRVSFAAHAHVRFVDMLGEEHAMKEGRGEAQLQGISLGDNSYEADELFVLTTRLVFFFLFSSVD